MTPHPTTREQRRRPDPVLLSRRGRDRHELGDPRSSGRRERMDRHRRDQPHVPGRYGHRPGLRHLRPVATGPSTQAPRHSVRKPGFAIILADPGRDCGSRRTVRRDPVTACAITAVGDWSAHLHTRRLPPVLTHPGGCLSRGRDVRPARRDRRRRVHVEGCGQATGRRPSPAPRRPRSRMECDRRPEVRCRRDLLPRSTRRCAVTSRSAPRSSARFEEQTTAEGPISDVFVSQAVYVYATPAEHRAPRRPARSCVRSSGAVSHQPRRGIRRRRALHGTQRRRRCTCRGSPWQPSAFACRARRRSRPPALGTRWRTSSSTRSCSPTGRRSRR